MAAGSTTTSWNVPASCTRWWRPGASRPFSVVGQLCTPKDVLSRGRQLVDPAVGDLLVLPMAGAYGYNISHADFLCHPRPEQVFVGRGDG